MSAVAWDSLGGISTAASSPCFFSGSLFIPFVVSLSLSPVWTETKRLQGKLQRSKLVRHSSNSSRLTHRHSVVGRDESECKTRTAYQLMPTSPVAKKRSVDRPIRTERTESVTDWANRTGATGFLPVLNTEAWWENTEMSQYSQTTSLTYIAQR